MAHALAGAQLRIERLLNERKYLMRHLRGARRTADIAALRANELAAEVATIEARLRTVDAELIALSPAPARIRS